jgi:hypothetical protein
MDYLPGGDPGAKKNYFVQNQRPGLTYYELGEFKIINGERKRKFIDAGDARPLGVIMYFQLENEPKEISLEMLDENDNVLRKYGKEEMSLNFGSGTVNDGLNKFVWDMRLTMVNSIPKRPPTPIRPFVKPGKYTAKLTVDGISELQDFNIFLNPNENYTKAETDTKYTFWLEVYKNVQTSTNNVNAALKVKEDVTAIIKTARDGGSSEETIRNAEAQAEVINTLVDNYEGTFVSRGRTLAEVINLPATLLFKITWLNGIMEVSEGPPTQSMRDVFARVVEETNVTNAEYNTNIETELAKLYEMLN